MPRGRPIRVTDPSGREWTIAELSELTGCTYQSLHLRLRNHPGDWKAISAPRDVRAVRASMGDRLSEDSELTAEQHTKMYRRWQNMLRRCHNPQDRRYRDYGGRGIEVHPDWRTYPQGFDEFLRYVGLPPFEGAQIDRIDNNKGYEPGNLRWVTPEANNQNRRPHSHTKYLPSPTGDGTMVSIHDAARLAGLPYSTLYNRLRRGYFKTADLYKPPRRYARG